MNHFFSVDVIILNKVLYIVSKNDANLVKTSIYN